MVNKNKFENVETVFCKPNKKIIPYREIRERFW